MLCCFSMVRDLRVFWRYRDQNRSYETMKYYLVLALVNIVLLVFYLGCTEALIQTQLHYLLILLVIFHASTLITIIKTHCTDPGYLPSIKKETDFVFEIEAEVPPFNGKIFFGEMHKYTVTRHHLAEEIKFCQTCNIYRPNLTSHCSKCKKCVKEMDHHCPWLDNCIGKGNYNVYYLHLFSSVGLVSVLSLLCAYLLLSRQNSQFGIVPVILVSVLTITILCGIPLIMLFSIHTYFLTQGISTRIFMKRQTRECQKKKDNVTLGWSSKIRTLLAIKSVQPKIEDVKPTSNIVMGDLEQDKYSSSSNFAYEGKYVDGLSKSQTQVTTSSIPFVN